MVGLDREHEGHHFVRQFIKNQAESNEFMVMKPTMLHGIANVFDHNAIWICCQVRIKNCTIFL